MSFFHNLPRRQPARRKAASRRLSLEALESRDLLSGYALGPLVQVSGPSLYANSTADNLPPQDILLNSEDENQVAVDPTNPNHFVALWQGDEAASIGWRGQNVGVTFDGGKTWRVAPLPSVTQVSGGPLQSTSDPWLAFAPNGDLYATCGAFNNPQQFPSEPVEDNVLVLKSTDGGLTWGAPTVLHDNTDARAFNDSESITTDPADPRFACMVWTFVSLPSGVATRNEQPVLGYAGIKGPVLFTRTTDGGQTWEPVQTIYDPGANALTVSNKIVVRPDGTLVDFFDETLANKNNDGGTKFESNLSLLTSPDKGQTWQNGTPTRAAKMLPLPVSDPDNGIPIDGTNAPQELFDVAQDSHSGYLYAVWRDGRFSGGQYNSIAFSMSTDGGLSWSAPIKINKTPTNIPAGEQQAWLPSVKVAADGTVAVTYYDFRNNDAKLGLATDYWAVFGKPTTPTALTDPADWGNELRLTNRSFDLEKALDPGSVPGLFLGDYEGLQALGNDFVATFCVAGVSRTDPKSIFFRRLIAPPVAAPAVAPAAPSTSEALAVAGGIGQPTAAAGLLPAGTPRALHDSAPLGVLLTGGGPASLPPSPSMQGGASVPPPWHEASASEAWRPADPATAPLSLGLLRRKHHAGGRADDGLTAQGWAETPLAGGVLTG
jgi:hypothetical protein